jgi:serine/threonine-protein kinase RsbW
LDEVVVNAIIHGNDADPDLTVEAGLWIADGAWTFRIRDRGTGFRPDQVPDPGDPDSLLLEHGRGIRIMLDWLDELIYYHGGSTAHLRRRYLHAHL